MRQDKVKLFLEH